MYLKDMQQRLAEWHDRVWNDAMPNNSEERQRERKTLKIAEETFEVTTTVGRICSKVIKGVQPNHPSYGGTNLEEEIADVFVTLSVLASAVSIDLEDAINNKVAKLPGWDDNA